MKFPILGDNIDGKFTFKIFENYKINITKEELYKAYEKGYKMHMLRACVVDEIGNPFE
jgi:hypothetical protein